jgi:hypothetical protein
VTAGQPGTGRDRERDPIVILAYRHCGAERLQRMLSGHAALACTSGTGLLPLCERAAATWRDAEGRDELLSPLATASIRALASSVITAVLARTGGLRWCETVFTPASCGELFLRLYPAAKFLCLHRSCLDVIDAAVRENPWGPTHPAFQSFAAGSPGNTVATVAAYWAVHTEQILDFEQAHPGSCHRVRYEDLIGNPAGVDDETSSFLSLEPAARHWLDDDGQPASEQPGTGYREAEVPVGNIPPPLRARVSQLLTRIGYPPIGGDGPPGAARRNTGNGLMPTAAGRPPVRSADGGLSHAATARRKLGQRLARQRRLARQAIPPHPRNDTTGTGLCSAGKRRRPARH